MCYINKIYFFNALVTTEVNADRCENHHMDFYQGPVFGQLLCEISQACLFWFGYRGKTWKTFHSDKPFQKSSRRHLQVDILKHLSKPAGFVHRDPTFALKVGWLCPKHGFKSFIFCATTISRLLDDSQFGCWLVLWWSGNNHHLWFGMLWVPHLLLMYDLRILIHLSLSNILDKIRLLKIHSHLIYWDISSAVCVRVYYFQETIQK